MTYNIIFTMQNKIPEYVTVAQYCERKKIPRTSVMRLVNDGFITFTIIAGKNLIDWDEYGSLDGNSESIAIERKVKHKGDAVDKALLKEVKELKGLVKVLSDKLG